MPGPIQVALDALMHDVDEADDPAKAALVSQQHFEAWRDALAVLAKQRRMVFRAAMRAGLSRSDMAKMLGLSRQRVEQIAQTPGIRKRHK